MLIGVSPNAFAAQTQAEERVVERTGLYGTYVDRQSRFINGDLGKAKPIAMADLLPALMKAIDRLSKYTIPDSLPRVQRVPHAKIEELACGGAKCAALAVYRSGEGVYIDKALNLETEVFARSVLLHELVHYVQDVAGERAEAEPCKRWYRRERQAYAIQMRFLALFENEAVVAAYLGSAGLACPPKVENPSESGEPPV